MLRNRLYYGVKPFVPTSVRRFVRGWVARQKRSSVSGVWPILPGSERKPDRWPGWPGGKQFAFVLTHDVEGPGGLSRCRQLMETEMAHGFRSSFNFIPEGGYDLPAALREELTAKGFEVGVHDLRHDGKLYQGREDFARKAARINNYLREWGAVGFRSGFMLHNLEWLHDLDIQYDASTFDTDPFEPQPDCAGTIFPFWKEAAPGRGYVELPYTLPQDSTIFSLLQEQGPEVWIKKLDWVASHGGMVMVIVHPDYVIFKGDRVRPGAFPVRHYEKLLAYVRERYSGSMWHALPREVAAWYRESCASKTVMRTAPATVVEGGAPAYQPFHKKRAAVILYSYYATDPRPRRETETLQRAGMEIDVLCLRKDASMPGYEKINGVNVYRAPLSRRRASKLTYVAQYVQFFLHALFFLSRRGLVRRYDLVHVHNMPDFLVFTAPIPKALGAKILLDLHDPMPELMTALFGLRPESREVRLVKLLEKASIGFSDQVLTVNRACQNIFNDRSCPPGKLEVVMNSPDPAKFRFRSVRAHPLTGWNRRFVLMYHGSIVKRNGLDVAIRCLPLLRENIPHVELKVFGAHTEFLDICLTEARALGVEKFINYAGEKTPEEIAGAITECDVGVISNARSLFTEINTPTRIFEYLSQGKPVVAPRAQGIMDYFGLDELFFFELGNVEDLARCILAIYADPAEAEAVTARGQDVYLQHDWDREREVFLGTVGKLLGITPPAPPAAPTSRRHDQTAQVEEVAAV